MKKYILTKTLVIIAILFYVFPHQVSAFTRVSAPAVGALATPTVYRITISKIEFKNSNNEYVTFFSGSTSLDIADVNVGEDAGDIGAGASLPVGTYSEMRVTLSRTFGIVASVTGLGGFDARTNTGNSTTNPLGWPITNVAVATRDSSPPTEQSIAIPNGTDVTTILTANNMTESGGDILMTIPISFSISDSNAVMPAMQMDFNVTNSVEFAITGAQTAIFPLPPEITATV